MSKYDFEIDLSENTSTGIILGDIREGSVVLEFGCATGRMTRYMKEQLSCRVYIVEYEQKAFDVAVQYADGKFTGYNTTRSSMGPDNYGSSLTAYFQKRKLFGTVLIGIRNKH